MRGAIGGLLLSLFAFAAPAFAQPTPSFDCTVELTAAETEICVSETLAGLDRKMNDVFASLKRRLGDGEQKRLVGSQRQWLKERESCGSQAPCIELKMSERIAELEEWQKPPGASTDGGFPHAARTFGGIVRSGPGMDFPKVASLEEGIAVTLVADAGVDMGGFQWFAITWRGKKGFMWGGIMCSKGDHVTGVLSVCE